MDFFEAIIKNKRYNRFQSEQPLTQDQLKQLLACAQLAPSLSSVQNFAYIIVTDESIKHEVAKKVNVEELDIKSAAVILAIVVVADENDDKNIIDAIIASHQLILGATSINLSSNLIVDFDSSIDELLGVDGNLSIIGLIPIGEALDSGHQGLKRSISDLAFHNSIKTKYNFE